MLLWTSLSFHPFETRKCFCFPTFIWESNYNHFWRNIFSCVTLNEFSIYGHIWWMLVWKGSICKLKQTGWSVQIFHSGWNSLINDKNAFISALANVLCLTLFQGLFFFCLFYFLGFILLNMFYADIFYKCTWKTTLCDYRKHKPPLLRPLSCRFWICPKRKSF